MKLAAPAELTRDTHFSPLSVHEAARWGSLFCRSTTVKVAGLSPASCQFRTPNWCSTLHYSISRPDKFLCCRGSYFYPACPDIFRRGWVWKKIWLVVPRSLVPLASWSCLASSNDFSTFFGRGFFLTFTQGDFSSFAFFITTFYAMLESKMERCFTVKFYIQRRDMWRTRCKRKYANLPVIRVLRRNMSTQSRINWIMTPSLTHSPITDLSSL